MAVIRLIAWLLWASTHCHHPHQVFVLSFSPGLHFWNPRAMVHPATERVNSASFMSWREDNLVNGGSSASGGGGGLDDLDELQKIVREASELSLQADNRVGELQQRIEYLENEIIEKEATLKNSSDTWSLEKLSLLTKVAELTKMVGNNNNNNGESRSENELKLEKELSILKSNLDETLAILKETQEAAEEMRARLADGEDLLEYEQMRFTKEKKQLGIQIEAERMKMNEVAKEFQREQEKFVEERDGLMGQLDNALKKLMGTENQLKDNQRKYEKESSSLKEKINTLRNELNETKNRLSSETRRFTQERGDLVKELEDQKMKLGAVEELLKEKEIEFRKTKTNMDRKLGDERQNVEKLTRNLERETNRFVEEKSSLQAQLSSERAKLSEVESQLEEDAKRFQKEKEDLENKLVDAERVRRIKARQMNDRYNEIRWALTERIEATKREARSSERRLTSKYEQKLAEVNNNVANLQSNLAEAETKYEQATVQLKDMTAARDRVLIDKENSDRSYQQTVSARNMEITSLKQDVQNLNGIIEENEEQIQRYETSYREMLKLSLKLTGKRITKAPSRLVNLVRRRKGDDN